MDGTDKKTGKEPNFAAIVGLVVIIIAVSATLAYCALATSAPTPRPISEVLANLRELDGQIVTIEGETSNVLNMLGIKAYDVTDETGTIKVITERGLPGTGDDVLVTGVVHEVFNVGPLNYTVIFEPAEKD